MNTSSVLPLRRLLLAVAGACGLLTLGGCVVVPAHHGYGQAPVYSPGPGYGAPVVVAPVAPPPPPVEVVPPLPFAGALWISGYWNWVGQRHVWVPGRWEAPRPGYRYEPHRWAPQGQGWGLQGGWRER